MDYSDDNNAGLWTSDDVVLDGAAHLQAHQYDPLISFLHGHPSPIFSPMPPEYYSAILEMGWAGESGGWDLSWLQEDLNDQLQGGGSGEYGADAGEEQGGGAVVLRRPAAPGAGIAAGGGCKNLLTERNRRMRLNQQLLALRLLVPCISKMDKRSILIDAAEYLQGIHSKIEMLEKEMTSEGELTSPSNPNLSPSLDVSEHNSRPTIPYKILEIDIEKIIDRLFSIKVIFERAKGIQAQIQRVTESLGFDISNTMIHPLDEHKMLSTSFMHVRKQKHLTEESLKKRIIEASLTCGIMVENDD